MSTNWIVSELGSLVHTLDAVAKVSVWHIPMGTDYENAEPLFVYFNDMETAQRFERKYSMPPEMAFLQPL